MANCMSAFVGSDRFPATAPRGQYPLLDGFQRAAPPPAFKLNAEGSVAVSTEVYWNEDMRQCPRGSKCQLLGAGGVAVYGSYDGAPFWVGWAPVPKRRGV